MQVYIFKQSYGEFTEQKDGRLSGHVMTITGKRKDGKYTVVHAFGNGKRFKNIYTSEQLYDEVMKFERKEVTA